jgi:hypothetical protein
MDKALSTKLITEMRRVRDDVMPDKILEEHRGSSVAGAALEMIRDQLDNGAQALADQDSEKALETFGELKAIS